MTARTARTARIARTADLLSKMLGYEVMVTEWRSRRSGPEAYLVRNIASRADAFSVARSAMNAFDGDPESGDEVKVRVFRSGLRAGWYVTVEWVR